MRKRSTTASVGGHRHLVLFESPGAPIPDGDGGYTQEWTPLSPATWKVSIRPATAKDQEHVIAGTIVTHVSHIVHGRFHPQVTTLTRMIHAGRTYLITAVENPDLRNKEMQLVAELQVPTVVH